MELFGLGSALDVAPQRVPQPGSAAHLLLKGREDASTDLEEGNTGNFARLRQAMIQEWRRASLRERLAECVRWEQVTVKSGERERVVTAAAAPPTPAEILTSSSIRMMLSMASAFRRSNPSVLEAMCGTLLELLLETPHMVLAPLRLMPSSIEANTFRRVGEFCAELAASTDPGEQACSLGLYLALGVSRGDVGGLVEVVVCWLNRHPCLLGRESDPADMTGSGLGKFSVEQEAGVSAVLGRLANHCIDLHLSFPDECDATRLVIKLPAYQTPIDFDCSASATTDGRFVYAWHPDIGILKAGTGLRGTTKGRVYAKNSLAAERAGTVESELNGHVNREGHIALIGDTIYLQTGGCMISPPRFLVARKADLSVEGSIDAPALASPFPDRAMLPSARTDYLQVKSMPGDVESKTEDSEREEKVSDALGDGEQKPTIRRQHLQGATVGPLIPSVPLCCDGRLVYALVPLEGTGRPSVIAVDLANNPTRRATAAVELQRPSLASASGQSGTEAARPVRQSDGENLPTEYPGGDNIQVESGSQGFTLGGGDSSTKSTASGEWPWWQNGSARPGVRMYCNGDRLVVCWLDEPAHTASGTEKSPPTWRGRVARAEARPGMVLSPADSACSASTDVSRITHMARFRLATGMCEPVENNAALSGSWRPRPPCVAYDSSSNLILRCSLRQTLPLPSSPPSRGANASNWGAFEAELCVCLWRNCGLAPGPLADGPFEWRGILRTLDDGSAEDRYHTRAGVQGKGEGGDWSASRYAVIVLAHLDRLGAHYLGWGRNKVDEDETGTARGESGDKSVPFCYDLSQATFRHLVGLVETYSGSLADLERSTDNADQAKQSVSQQGVYVLCASLRLLNVNIGILLSRGLGVTEFGGEALRQSLLRCLLELAKGYDGSEKTRAEAGRIAAAREALEVMVASIDLLYPTERCQASLLSSYLRAYGGSSGENLPPAALTMTMELLARVASSNFLQALKTTDGVAGQKLSGVWTEGECQIGPGLGSEVFSPLASDAVTGLSKALLHLSTRQSVRDVRQAATGGSLAENGAGSLQGDHVIGAAGQVGQAVLGAFGAVLELRSADAFEAVKLTREAARTNLGTPPHDSKSRPLMELVLAILRAADDVLASVEHTCLFPGVFGALRSGVVGFLLPSCLSSALALLGEGLLDGWVGSYGTYNTKPLLVSLQERLVEVTGKVGRLAMMSCAEGAAIPATEDSELCGVDQGTVGSHQIEHWQSEVGVNVSAGLRPKVS